MQDPPIPENEADRLQAVNSLAVLDTPTEERFDALTRGAAAALHAPICTISIIDSNREWFKSCVGTAERQADRSTSFCGHTIVSGKMLIIEDTLRDPRFADNPQVVEPPHVRFYAGVTLFDRKTRVPVGAFCVKDVQPRSLELEEMNILMDYAHRAEVELNAGLPLQTSTVTSSNQKEPIAPSGALEMVFAG